MLRALTESIRITEYRITQALFINQRNEGQQLLITHYIFKSFLSQIPSIGIAINLNLQITQALAKVKILP